MSIKTIPYKSNQTLIITDRFTAHLSYGVPQVIEMKPGSGLDNTVLVNNDKYSNTTNKHRNAYLRTVCHETNTIIPATPAEIQEITDLETPFSHSMTGF
tara:strand:- start:597 stop:893 length:297 start_codon:yes stop_codon:yes gene_type:complete